MAAPAVVLGWGLYAITTYSDPFEVAWRGRVEGAACLEDLTAACVDAQVQASPPQVVIIGNSLARSHIDQAVLAAGLGLTVDDVLLLNIGGSAAPHWVAVAHRVLASGARPRMILVVGDLQSALQTSPRTPVERADLEGVLGDDLASLGPTLGVSDGWWDQLDGRRVRLRRAIVDRVRMLVGEPVAPGRGRARVMDAATRVFDDRDLAKVLTREIRNGFASEAVPPEALVAPADSLLPDLFALGEQYGVAVVLVRAPLSPRNPTPERDPVRPEIPAEVAALASPPSAYIDAADVMLGRTSYADLAHLGRRGAATFTSALLDRMAAPAVDPGLVPGWAHVVEPPSIVPRAAERGPGGTSRWSLPQVGATHLAMWSGGQLAPPECLPVHLVGLDHELPWLPCGDLFAGHRLGRCFDGAALFARLPSGTDPASVTLDVDAARGCGDFTWLYPGDVVRWSSLAGGRLRVVASGDEPPSLLVRAANEQKWPLVGGSGTLVAEVDLPGPGPVEIENASPDGLVVLWSVQEVR
ncbi:MAG: hypothetical protein H6738_19660 [Alphaproteobacteria bacterium]|nr:hypothetical protein [Alphaproteobacteria bacterium]